MKRVLSGIFACALAASATSALAQTKLLSRLSARRDAQLRFAGDGRNFDLRAQSRLRHGDRDRDIDVVALAGEILVMADVRDDEKIPWRRAQTPALAFAGNPHPRASVDTCRNPHLNVFNLGHSALAFAQRTRRTSFTGAPTVHTFLREAQPAAGFLDLT